MSPTVAFLSQTTTGARGLSTTGIVAITDTQIGREGEPREAVFGLLFVASSDLELSDLAVVIVAEEMRLHIVNNTMKYKHLFRDLEEHAGWPVVLAHPQRQS
jgi:hypothetical protein